jgi:hypothetical protein
MPCCHVFIHSVQNLSEDRINVLEYKINLADFAVSYVTRRLFIMLNISCSIQNLKHKDLIKIMSVFIMSVQSDS